MVFNSDSDSEADVGSVSEYCDETRSISPYSHPTTIGPSITRLPNFPLEIYTMIARYIKGYGHDYYPGLAALLNVMKAFAVYLTPSSAGANFGHAARYVYYRDLVFRKDIQIYRLEKAVISAESYPATWAHVRRLWISDMTFSDTDSELDISEPCDRISRICRIIKSCPKLRRLEWIVDIDLLLIPRAVYLPQICLEQLKIVKLLTPYVADRAYAFLKAHKETLCIVKLEDFGYHSRIANRARIDLPRVTRWASGLEEIRLIGKADNIECITCLRVGDKVDDDPGLIISSLVGELSRFSQLTILILSFSFNPTHILGELQLLSVIAHGLPELQALSMGTHRKMGGWYNSWTRNGDREENIEVVINLIASMRKLRVLRYDYQHCDASCLVSDTNLRTEKNWVETLTEKGSMVIACMFHERVDDEDVEKIPLWKWFDGKWKHDEVCYADGEWEMCLDWC